MSQENKVDNDGDEEEEEEEEETNEEWGVEEISDTDDATQTSSRLRKVLLKEKKRKRRVKIPPTISESLSGEAKAGSSSSKNPSLTRDYSIPNLLLTRYINSPSLQKRFWAVVVGLVVIALLIMAILELLLYFQHQIFYDTSSNNTGNFRMTHKNKHVARAGMVDVEPPAAKVDAANCIDDPLPSSAFGARWEECVSREWDFITRTEGTIVNYLCWSISQCYVILSAKCIHHQWIYMKFSARNCKCSVGDKRRKRRGFWNFDKFEESPHVILRTTLWPMSTIALKTTLPSSTRKSTKAYESATTTEFFDIYEGGAAHKDRLDDGRRPFCHKRPPERWGCAVSDWSSKPGPLGYHPRSRGYTANYICHNRKECYISKTLECGDNGLWKVVTLTNQQKECNCTMHIRQRLRHYPRIL